MRIEIKRRRWTDSEKQTLARLFTDSKLPISEIAVKLGRTTASINDALTVYGIKRNRSVPRYREPRQMTVALARIHAHVCGDGHLFRYPEKDSYGYLARYRKGYYRIRFGFGYTNTRFELIREFITDVRKVFGLTPRYNESKKQIIVRSRPAWIFLKELGAGGSHSWLIPKQILQASNAVKRAWIKAFFDDEAHFVPGGGIRVRSVNRAGLEQVASMLRGYLPCHLTPKDGMYSDGSCYLALTKPARARFLKIVGSTKFHINSTAE